MATEEFVFWAIKSIMNMLKALVAGPPDPKKPRYQAEKFMKGCTDL